MMKKVLLVDDDAYLLGLFSRQLQKRFSVDAVENPREALERVEQGEEYAVVIADMVMPQMGGIELLSAIKIINPNAIRIILTGMGDVHAAARAVNQGQIFYFLTKPCSMEELEHAIELGLRNYELLQAEQLLLEQTLRGTVDVLSEILSMADPGAFGRAQGVKKLMQPMARFLQYPAPWEMEVAALLFPLGFITIPQETIRRARRKEPISPREEESLTRVPEVGRNLLSHIPRLESVASMIHYQDKNFDGSGFPRDGIAGHEIPLGGRVLRLLKDIHDSERRGLTLSESMRRLDIHSGFYDPALVGAARHCLLVDSPETSPAHQEVVAIGLRDLKIGHVLAENVQTSDGRLIVSAPFGVTPALKELLKNFQSIAGVKEPLFVRSPY